MTANLGDYTDLELSRYQIIEKIGEGGMGELFLAGALSLGRKATLKLLPVSLAREDQIPQRFLREARSAAALDHPYICHIHEAGEARHLATTIGTP